MAEIRRIYFEEGSAARVIEEPLPSREERERERRRKELEIRRARERRKRAAMRRNRVQTVYLLIGVCFAAVFFIGYVYLQADTQSTMRSVASLKEEIADLKAKNSAETNRIDAEANLSVVKDAAQNRLGMVYAGSDRIVYYTVGDSDYMSQYEDAK